MRKDFTVNIPDDWWVNKWEEGKTISLTYEGPETVYVVYDDCLTALYISEEQVVLSEDQPNRVAEITVNDDNVAGVYNLYTRNQNVDYTYNTITNHDGSTHQEVANPKLSDIFECSVIPKVDDTPARLTLNPIYKDIETINEKITKERLSYVQKYANTYEFEATDQAKINTFITACNEYLDTLSGAYPWRYVTMDKDEIPKIPISLITLFKTLPEIE